MKFNSDDSSSSRVMLKSEGMNYLHFSGKGETPLRDYAWSGTKQQAATLEARTKESGKPWVFHVVAQGGK